MHCAALLLPCFLVFSATAKDGGTYIPLSAAARDKLKKVLHGKSPQQIASIRKKMAQKQSPNSLSVELAPDQPFPETAPQKSDAELKSILSEDMSQGDLESLIGTAKHQLVQVQETAQTSAIRGQGKSGFAAIHTKNGLDLESQPKPHINIKEAEADMQNMLNQMQDILSGGHHEEEKQQPVATAPARPAPEVMIAKLKATDRYQSEEEFRHQLGEDSAGYVDPDQDDQPYRAHRFFFFVAIGIGLCAWGANNSTFSADLRSVSIPWLGNVRLDQLALQAGKVKSRAAGSWDAEAAYGDLIGPPKYTSAPLSSCAESASYGL